MPKEISALAVEDGDGDRSRVEPGPQILYGHLIRECDQRGYGGYLDS
jgi:hypothetical protein